MHHLRNRRYPGNVYISRVPYGSEEEPQLIECIEYRNIISNADKYLNQFLLKSEKKKTADLKYLFYLHVLLTNSTY